MVRDGNTSSTGYLMTDVYKYYYVFARMKRKTVEHECTYTPPTLYTSMQIKCTQRNGLN